MFEGCDRHGLTLSCVVQVVVLVGLVGLLLLCITTFFAVGVAVVRREVEMNRGVVLCYRC